MHSYTFKNTFFSLLFLYFTTHHPTFRSGSQKFCFISGRLRVDFQPRCRLEWLHGPALFHFLTKYSEVIPTTAFCHNLSDSLFSLKFLFGAIRKMYKLIKQRKVSHKKSEAKIVVFHFSRLMKCVLDSAILITNIK